MMNRRDFIQMAGATAAVASSAQLGFAADAKPVRLGVIGSGSRGQEVLRKFLRVPGVSIEGVCDVYEPRFGQTNRIAGKEVWKTKEYAALLDRKDIDAVLIASPVAFHKEHVIASSKAGKAIFGEKSFGFRPDHCQEILKELNRSNVLFQIGHEYRYASWFQEAVRRIHAGEIGDVTHIYAYWHRNGSWRRPVPSPELEHLINWRLYRESSGGLVTELGSHHIDVANWVFGEMPTHVLGTTSIVRYHDGRTVGDNVQATFMYSKGRRLVFSSLTDNAKQGNELWVYGTKGSVQLTIEDAYIYYEKGNTNLPAAANKTIVQNGIETGASYSSHGEMPYRGPGLKITVDTAEDPTLVSCHEFAAAVRGEKKILADKMVGYGSGATCGVAMDAVFTEVKTEIPAPVI